MEIRYRDPGFVLLLVCRSWFLNASLRSSASDTGAIASWWRHNLISRTWERDPVYISVNAAISSRLP